MKPTASLAGNLLQFRFVITVCIWLVCVRVCVCLLCFCRGDEFRPEYSKLGEVRSLIPPGVRFMALTATASKSSREHISRSLYMRRPALVYVPPQKKNIFYAMKAKMSMEELVHSLAETLKCVGTAMPRIIIFCKKYDECSSMYAMFKFYLGKNFTSPPNSPDLTKYRLVDMYTRCTEVKVKEAILNSFCKPDGKLRIVIGTIAFGMGLDCADVRQTIHWGLSSDVESHIQETGRAGRDGFLSCSLLLHTKADRQTASDQMGEYSKNETICRRKLLFDGFEGCDSVNYPCTKCQCCDVCSSTCSCDLCSSGKRSIQHAFFLP